MSLKNKMLIRVNDDTTSKENAPHPCVIEPSFEEPINESLTITASVVRIENTRQSEVDVE